MAPQIASSPVSCETNLPLKCKIASTSSSAHALHRTNWRMKHWKDLDFDRYPLVPMGTRAIIYKDLDTRAPWAPHRQDAWYLGPSKDHYHCHHYYVPKTRGYRISESADLFSQHCQEPAYSHYSHVQELSLKLQENLLSIRCKVKTLKVLKLLVQHLEAYTSNNPPLAPEQRVEDEEQRVLGIISWEDYPVIQRVSAAPPTMLANNSTSKRVLQSKMRTHQRITWRNTLSAMPKITLPKIAPPLQANTQTPLAAPHVINDMPPALTTLMVLQLQTEN